MPGAEEVFHSTDIGSNWTRVSTNRGTSWISVNTGLTDIDITSIAVTQGYIFAGTSNGNIWRRPLNEIPLSIRKNKLNISEDIILKGNYPNPFNPVTKIKYELRVANYVTVTVYDVSGNKVETLVNQKQNAGSYEVEFDARLSPPSRSRERGSDLSSGVYFYKVESGDFAEVKRMVLLK
ncbi:MAG: T9SS type A sorting domain-containing protein [Ignavibacteria bacterium]|nr:T9SS type A sorting domain-containing protein [Ignavibacteria bacterium]